METKFTKGPWSREGHTVYALNEDGANVFTVQVMAGYASLWPMIRTTQQEVEEIGCLIAAAPKLYAELERMVELYEHLAYVFAGDEEKYEELSRRADSARSALAKARGEAK